MQKHSPLRACEYVIWLCGCDNWKSQDWDIILDYPGGPGRISNTLLYEVQSQRWRDNKAHTGVENCYTAGFEDREKGQESMKGDDLLYQKK